MRLIDADALLDSLTVDPIGCAGCPEPEFMDELIDILDTAPTVEPQGDLISRADAVKTVIRMCSPICAWQVGTQQYPDCVGAEINALPSAEIPTESTKTPTNTPTDLISRADAIKGIQDGYCSCVSDCIDEINKLQSIGTDCTDFIHWISKVVADEELWELNAVGYGEIICRKLVKIGALATTEKPPYYYVPSVSAERVGEWIDENGNKVEFDEEYCPKHWAKCSVCDDWLTASDEYAAKGRYCPNCGAKMKGGDNE